MVSRCCALRLDFYPPGFVDLLLILKLFIRVAIGILWYSVDLFYNAVILVREQSKCLFFVFFLKL